MDINQISQTFFKATNLSIFIFDEAKVNTATFKMTVAPQLPHKLTAQLLDRTDQNISISIFSRIGSIATFKVEDTNFIIWATSNAISGNGRYDDKVPLIDFDTFKSQLSLFYLALTSESPNFIDNQINLTDYDMIDRPNQELEPFMMLDS